MPHGCWETVPPGAVQEKELRPSQMQEARNLCFSSQCLRKKSCSENVKKVFKADSGTEVHHRYIQNKSRNSEILSEAGGW